MDLKSIMFILTKLDKNYNTACDVKSTLIFFRVCVLECVTKLTEVFIAYKCLKFICLIELKSIIKRQ